MDLYSSSVTSIEGYNHAVKFTDRHSGYRWQYGLKTKDEVLHASKRWFTEIADIRQKYPLLSVVRDKAGENTSKELNDFLTENGRIISVCPMNNGKMGSPSHLWVRQLFSGEPSWPNQEWADHVGILPEITV